LDLAGKECAVPQLNILISGGGIAGCTLAYWLTRYGHAVTVVERSEALRSSGAPVDVRAPATHVVERMNIVPKLRKASASVAGVTLLDGAGRQCARVDLKALERSIDPRHIELPRGDLATILHGACRDSAEFIFGDSIRSLTQDGGPKVDVEFRRSPPRQFDLVIGADGLHSNVRRLAFGPESRFVRHAGLYVATLPLPQDVEPGGDIVMLNVPGKCVALHPSRGRPLALLIFWHAEMTELDASNPEEHKRVLAKNFSDIGWDVPKIVDEVRVSRDLYFDSVSRVELTEWARGRIALLGDASSCVSLFGDGSTLAIAGAHTLAKAIAESPADQEAAFRRYQAEHGQLVALRHSNLAFLASLLVPRTRLGISLRNRILRMTRPVFAAAQLMGRRMQFAEK